MKSQDVEKEIERLTQALAKTDKSILDKFADECWTHTREPLFSSRSPHWEFDRNKFAQLIVRECIDKIETYRIPVGNSFSGELACEWTYAALKEIRDDIKETFGVLE